jgi:molybdate transport system ATP-binding protein
VVGTENVLATRLVRREGGLIVVRAGETELVAVDPGGVESEAYACIRAEEVILEPPNGHLTSALNQLAGEIVDCRNEGPLVRVTIACGIRLVAVVTHASVERLRLAPGTRVCAMVKAPSIRIVPSRSPAALP